MKIIPQLTKDELSWYKLFIKHKGYMFPEKIFGITSLKVLNSLIEKGLIIKENNEYGIKQ